MYGSISSKMSYTTLEKKGEMYTFTTEIISNLDRIGIQIEIVIEKLKFLGSLIIKHSY